MFSSRLDWDRPPNRLSQALHAKRRAGAPVLDLTESNPTHAGFDYDATAILSSLSQHAALRYDPEPAGLISARAAVAARYPGAAPERVLLTASTSEAYAWLFKLLADPGDEVLVPRPSYPLFDFLAALESVRIIHYPLLYDHGWSIDSGVLADAVTPRTRAIIVVNPNNPTGSFLKRAELDRFIELCARHGLSLISDEVFADFAFAPDPARVDTLALVDAVPTFCLSGLSKIAALPQMKLGWIVANSPAAIRRLEFIADTFLSVGTPVQHALPALLETARGIQQQIRSRTATNLAHLRASIAESPCTLLQVEGGWYATLQVPRTRTEEEWCLDLLAHGDVLVQPGFFYDFGTEAFLVLSLLTAPAVFRQGVQRLLARLQ